MLTYKSEIKTSNYPTIQLSNNLIKTYEQSIC